jgi:hypothetical protein
VFNMLQRTSDLRSLKFERCGNTQRVTKGEVWRVVASTPDRPTPETSDKSTTNDLLLFYLPLMSCKAENAFSGRILALFVMREENGYAEA